LKGQINVSASPAAQRRRTAKAIAYAVASSPPAGEAIEIAPGVRWLHMPLPFVLDHINLWLIEDGDAWALVDTGIGMPEVQAIWEVLLARLDRPIGRILVTHCHPDHLGLARWLSDRSGAPVEITQGEMLTAEAWWNQLPGHDVEAMIALFRRHGLDAARLDALASRGPSYRRRVPSLPRETRRLLDGDALAIGGREWRVVTGYGHSPEHACLHCAELGVLIAGDMVLPRITTNVSVLASTPEDDPLGRYLDSLRRFAPMDRDTLVLPSHGRPFRGLHARIAQLRSHHAERLDALRAACAKPSSAADCLPTLFSRELDPHQVMFAMGESIAHLNHLERAGALSRRIGADGVERFLGR